MNLLGYKPSIEYFENLLDKLIANSRIEPRDYQRRIITKSLYGFYSKGFKSIAVESPCGSGKTICALAIMKIIQDLEFIPMTIVSIRRNLLNQAQNENIEKRIGLNLNTVSLFEKNPAVKNGLLWHDEGHHDSVESAAHIHNTIKPKYILATSATNFRTDKVKLCFEHIIKEASISRLIKDGWLSKFDYYSIPRWEVNFLLDLYLKYKERFGKSIFYFHRVETAFNMYNRLRRLGVKADLVTSTSNRELQLELFESGKTEVIVNCMVLTEGFNCPSLNTVFVRPSSKLPTIQMAGRVLRTCKELPIKNIVQDMNTKYSFLKVALPNMQYIYEDEKWLSIKPTEAVDNSVNNVIKAVGHIKVELPQYIQLKKLLKKSHHRRRARVARPGE